MDKNQIAKKVFSILNVEPNPARNSIFNLFYESVKDEVLRAKFWEFAVCQKELNPLGKEGNKFLYTFPTASGMNKRMKKFLFLLWGKSS